MERLSVDSSMVNSVGYAITSQELEVEFNTGKVYRYQGVPVEIYEQLLAAESKGRFMHEQIIDHYPYDQVA